MPLALGYVHRRCSLRHLEIGTEQQMLAEAARAQGHTLGTVHVDDALTDPDGFAVLLQAASTEQHVSAVIVPTLDILGDPEDPLSKFNQLLHRGILALSADRPVVPPEPQSVPGIPVIQGCNPKRRRSRVK
ncbi:hypothetical protein OG474_28510 [Kribbella sp. NBC_01505]|uniref:hypothetical protein n=1 Tax=Kribbella sp. NBC_01505 TaxID=2903580 RepID=UPI0038666E04